MVAADKIELLHQEYAEQGKECCGVTNIDKQ